MAPSNPIKDLFMALIFMVIGLALTPIVNSSTAVAIADPNASATVKALLALVPILYVVLIIGGSVAYVVFSFKGR